MSRFLPIPLDWTIHPICIILRTENPAYPDRWLHLIRRAHIENRGGRLLLYDDTPLDARALGHDHDRDEVGWTNFLETCLQLGLLEQNDNILQVRSWKYWYRAPSEYPEVEKHSRAESRARSELEKVRIELAVAARERDELKKRVKAKAETDDQLKFEIRDSEERADRISEHENTTEHGADPLPETTSEDRADRVPKQASDIQADLEQPTLRSCPDPSGAVQNCPDNRSTPTNTCKSRESTHVVSSDSNVAFLGEEAIKIDFWRRAEDLFSRTSKKRWSFGRAKLEVAIDKISRDYPEPQAWWWALASAVQETVLLLSESKDVKCTWSYATALIPKYAPYGAKIAWQKRRGEPTVFVRLSELEAV